MVRRIHPVSDPDLLRLLHRAVVALERIADQPMIQSAATVAEDDTLIVAFGQRINAQQVDRVGALLHERLDIEVVLIDGVAGLAVRKRRSEDVP
jgi:hypothetical protein